MPRRINRFHQDPPPKPKPEPAPEPEWRPKPAPDSHDAQVALLTAWSNEMCPYGVMTTGVSVTVRLDSPVHEFTFTYNNGASQVVKLCSSEMAADFEHFVKSRLQVPERPPFLGHMHHSQDRWHQASASRRSSEPPLTPYEQQLLQAYQAGILPLEDVSKAFESSREQTRANHAQGLMNMGRMLTDEERKQFEREHTNHPVKSRIEILGLPKQAGKSMANYMVMPPEVTR